MSEPHVRSRRWKPTPRFGAGLAVLALVALLPLQVAAQGVITGTVTEAGTQRPLVNAQVYIQGTTLGSLSNARGQFTIQNAPAGEVTVRAELIGMAAQNQTVTVVTGRP